MWRAVLCLLFCSTSVFAGSVTASARFHRSSTQADSADETFLAASDLTPWLQFDLGGRFTQSSRGVLHGFDYKGELTLHSFDFLPFAKTAVRVAQRNQFTDSFSTTELLFLMSLSMPETWPVGLYFDGGWYKRYPLLEKMAVIPSFRSSLSEHDFAVTVGSYVWISDVWKLDLRASTFDELRVFNLNHPYAELAAKYKRLSDAPELSAFLRYHILLGFGRMDEWMFGFRLKFPLGIFAEMDTAQIVD